jgi:hypothetical protein
MNDASRVTWSGVFFTLGATMALGAIIRWGRWDSAGGSGEHPQVLWTLGSLAIGFLLVALQLRLPLWARRWAEREAEQKFRDAGGNYWGDE